MELLRWACCRRLDTSEEEARPRSRPVWARLSWISVFLQAVEGLLDATSGADADLLLRYRECHLLVLKALQDGRAYGPQWCNKQITR